MRVSFEHASLFGTVPGTATNILHKAHDRNENNDVFDIYHKSLRAGWIQFDRQIGRLTIWITIFSHFSGCGVRARRSCGGRSKK
jgi:hypothetical protein